MMLTPKQHKLLTFVHNYIQTNGYAPSFEEMFKALDLHSKSGIHRLLDALVERGFVTRMKNRSRAIEVIKLPADIAQERNICAFEITERAKEALGFGGMQFVVNPAVPEGEVWVNTRHGKGNILQKFAVGS